MFEAAELGHQISKADYEKEIPALRAGLLDAQRQLLEARVPLILIVSGADGAGKSETVNRLHEWFDPRGLETNVFGPLSDDERDRPAYWRFWLSLPPRGRVGMFFGSWYTDPIIRRVYRKSGGAEFDRSLSRIEFFEQELAQDGALIVKLWLHLSKKAQKKRLTKLAGDPKTRWRVAPIDWKHFKLYDRFVKYSEQALQRTDTGFAPWTVVEATDDRYREITVGRAVLEAVRKRLAAKKDAVAPVAHAALPGDPVSVLDRVDLKKTVTTKEYDRKLATLQGQLSRLSREAWAKKVSSVLVFEGWDAAGKGGTVRRLTSAMDARLYRVVPIAAPTDEERAHQYLWRFWRHIPRAGRVTIFDRSWYGRVLVERVEGFAREDEWKRAFQEINEFEDQLVENGTMVTKFWVHISKNEQLRRFKERAKTEFKQYKITDEDWRNRKQWDAYQTAINEMVVRTSTRGAPWVIVAGNDKRYARIQVLETVCRRLEKALG
ncbi:MAG: polyphosphate:AMP phosphotransferase [Vicinamibacteria bacterium]|nr:polyphosphate:AMP phosphotransferase [Vicinamibacteria bacterium]